MAEADGRLSTSLVAAADSAVGEGPCCVALGGGADSAVMLWAVVSAGPDGGVRAVFVDHGFEGSALLRETAIALADRLDVRIDVLEAPVPDGADLEARARAARYTAIESQLRDGEVAITAHTRDDQAETVVMRLARGSGATGLSGIPASRGRWRRPFLDVARADLREMAETLELPFTDDPANTDPRFTRSRIRHHVIPWMSEELGSSVSEALARSADLLSEDDAYIERQAAAVDLVADGARVSIPSAVLATVDPAVAARVCRRALSVTGAGHPGSRGDVATIMTAAVSGTPGELTGGRFVAREGALVVIGPAPTPDPPMALEVGTTVRWCDHRYRVHVESDAASVVPGGRFTVLDPTVGGRQLVLRGVEDGDRIVIEVGTTPVSELLRVHGVPPRQRPVSPVVTVDGKIAAVIGVRVAAWARPDGREALVIEREVDV